ncbi:hypothetical protein FRC17_004874 [Serendipita sp. 399]|nr:hypothetical protein FRC17_004874 [Serendipita sp. 399]
MSNPLSTGTSHEFPEGYGDFKLVSSNNVTFYFPKFLLSYQSSVFEGMFAVGASSANQSNELRLTEDSGTLECLLRYLDPKKRSVPPTVDNVRPLLEASRKYDIPLIAELWEEQLMAQWRGVPASDELISRPMECLAIASQFNLDQLTRFALRELLKAPLEKFNTDIIFESRTFLHLMKLRANRVDWFEGKFVAFLATNVSTTCSYVQYHDIMHRAVKAITREIHQEPSWKTIKKHMSDWPYYCGHYQGSENLFNSWKAEIEALETELPDLPSNLNTITTSPEFPEDYGDFKLISSDNVAFHFSRFLLSYQSSVFKGMFAVGESYVHQPDELLLTEDSNTLDCLLQYLDPKKVPTPPTVQSVQPLLEACRKYDIPTVAKRWEEQLMTVWRASPDLDETISRPFECLALASRFNLNLLARFALRELTKAPIAQLKTDVVFENWISMHLISLRAARVDWFERKFAAFLNSIPSAACNQTQSHVWMYIAVIKIIQELHKEPSWKTIRGHFNAWYVCTSCRKFEGASAVLNAWGADIAALEAEIPDLPSRL